MKPTEKLYYKDNKSITFEAKILEQYRDKKGWVIILDRTVFYPEGGGQPADKGWLNDIRVENVLKKDEIIMHFLPEEIKEEMVKGKINWEHRFDYMQQHTGQHLISGSFWKIGEYKTVSVNMSVDYITIEIESKDILEEDLKKVEELANSIIIKNFSISYILTNASEISKFNLRRSCLLEGRIRLISLGDFDCVACGGVHLDFTGEVRLVKLIKTEKIRGNIRTYWKIGDRAFLDYKNKAEMVSKLKTILNSNEGELDIKVNQLKNEISDLKLNKKILEKRIISFYKDNLLKNSGNSSGYKLIIKKWTNENDILMLNLTKSIISEQNIILFMLNKTNRNIKWIIGCSENIKIDFNNIRETLLKPFNCKGGGKHPLWQGVGNIEIDEDKFLNTFEAIIEI